MINVKTAISRDLCIMSHNYNTNTFLQSAGKRLLMIDITVHFFCML